MPLLPATLAGLPADGRHRARQHLPGLGIPYAFANIKLTAHWLGDDAVPAAWIRTPGRMQNTFGNESFLDEIAAAAGVDPFEIRLKYLDLTDTRGLELLERCGAREVGAAAVAARGQRRRRAGRGVSYVKYELVRTYVGVVADVRSIARPARSRSIESTSRTTAGRSSTPTACATRSRATSCRP